MAIWAIGDVHGHLIQLKTLLNALPMASRDELLFIGDLIDRGPDSAGVLRLVHRLREAYPVTVLRGNHEALMLAAREDAMAEARWRSFGGETTLASYGASKPEGIPEEDWRLLEASELFHEAAGAIYVHAGLDPSLDLDHQLESDLLWRHFDDLAPHDSGKFIVCGHSPQLSGSPNLRGHAMCIDTCDQSCGGWLTAVNLERRIFMQAGPTRETRCDCFSFLDT